MKRLLGSALCLASLAAFGCSRSDDPNTSSLADVANPGTPGEANAVFWVEQEQMVRAGCPAETLPSRSNCVTDIQRSPLAATTQNANATAAKELQAAAAETAQEIVKLKDNDPTVIAIKAEIQTVTTQKAALERAVASSTAELAKLDTAKTAKEAVVAYDDSQLAAVNKALEGSPADVDLLALKAQLTAERATYAAALVEINARIAAVTARQTYDSTTLAAASTHLTESQANLTKVYGELEVSSDRLDALKTKQALAEEAKAGISQVIALIRSETVTYRSNLFSLALQESLRIISDSFQPSIVLTPGRYEREGSSTSYCPQLAEPTMQGSTLVSLKLTYLSPCGGASNVYRCTNNRCVADSWVATVIDSTHYSYSGGSGVATFKFIRASFDRQGTEGGPLTAL